MDVSPSGGECRLIDVSSRRITFPGPRVSPSGEVKGERATNRETRPLTRRAAQAGPSSEVFTKHETRDTAFFRITAFVAARFAVVAKGSYSQKPPPGPTRPPPGHCLLAQNCPLLPRIARLKNIVSAPVALVPPGRCFPARCGAAWGGYGAAWAAAVPRSGNTACWVFHETRDMSHESRNTVFPIPAATPGRATPNPANRFCTNHETCARDTNAQRTFFLGESALFARQSADRIPARRRQARRLQGNHGPSRQTATKRCVNEWKEQRMERVFLNPETGITTYTESGFGSRFGIPHYSSVFVGKIRISPCRQSSAPEHCGNRDIGFMDVSSRRITFAGPQVSPSGEMKGERATNRETQPLTRRAAQASPGSEVFTKHETRVTNHGFFPNHNESKTRYSSVFVGIRRNDSDTPRAAVRGSLGHPGKVRKIPDPPGKCAKRSVRRRSRRPPGSLGCGQRKMNS